MFNSFLHGFKVPIKFYWENVYENIIQAQHTISKLTVDYWLNYTVGRWYWWFLVFWAIVPLIIWWKYTDRNRFLEVSFFGLMTSICAGILDTIGVFMGAWAYPYQFLPYMPNFFPIDYVVIPVVFMLIYQKYPGWKMFFIVTTIVSTFLTLILDPIMVSINIYQPLTWQYYYSAPTFVFMVSFAKWVTMIITGRDDKYGGTNVGN